MTIVQGEKAKKEKSVMRDALSSAPVGSPLRRFAAPLLPALATALLLYLSFFPVNWGWLGWIALVPLLSLLGGLTFPARLGGLTSPACNQREMAPCSSVYWAAWLGGLAFAVPALQWVRLASPPMYFAWLGLALVLSLHFVLFVWLTGKLISAARFPLLLAAPAVWTGLEYLRARIDIGFAWYYLGHTQHDSLAVIQIADLFGAYGVSFLLMLVNVLLFQLFQLAAWRWLRTNGFARPLADEPQEVTPGAALCPRGLLFSAVVVFSLLTATLVYGVWRLGQDAFAPGPRVALLQGNVPQYLRNDPQKAEEVADSFIKLADEASQSQPDLIVWSETSFITDWLFVSDRIPRDQLSPQVQEWDRETRLLALRAASCWQTANLLGLEATVIDLNGQRKYNSAILLDRDGTVLDRYDKIYRVPFGEYIPWEDRLPFMKWFSPYEADYSVTAGDRYTIFELAPGTYHFAALICYEDTVPHLAPQFLRHPEGDRPPDFFLNISNDGWFKGSEEHEQHLVASRFRAIECRRAVARAVNMGISAVIDGNGRIVAMPGRTWAESKNRPAVVLASVPLDTRASGYVVWGDVLPGLCWCLIGLGLVIPLVQWTYRRR